MADGFQKGEAKLWKTVSINPYPANVDNMASSYQC